MVYDKMRRKKPNASAPPDSLPEYFGNTREHIEDYCKMVQSRHPEVADPRHTVMRVNSANVLDEGLRIGGRGRWMNSKVKIQTNKAKLDAC
jgi:hypothetical protein